MFKIFISKSIYDRIIGDEKKKHTFLYKMLKWQEEQQYALQKQQPNKHILLKLDDAATKRYEDENWQSEVLNNPSSLYVLDIPKDTALAIQKRYGVVCVSGENPDVSPLLDVDDFFKPIPGEIKYNGWDKVLDNVEKIPSNALLLTDRYIFSSRSPEFGEGLGNIKRILNELLPREFHGDRYHVTIVFNREATHKSFTFKKIVDKLEGIKDELKIGRDYDIMMEVLCIKEECDIYDDLHSRCIVSNYYFVEATHKLAAFDNHLEGTVKQKIIPWALFTKSGLSGPSSVPVESIDELLADFKSFQETYCKQSASVPYFYAVDGEIMPRCLGLKNRLLK